MKPHLMPHYIIESFFILGIISALCFRIIIVFQHIRPEWVRPVWYVAIIGYIFFFLYRYEISAKRKKAVDEYDLIGKIKGKKKLTREERDVTLYLLTSLDKSMERWNYLFIFAFSIIAVIVDIILTYFI